MEEANIGLGMTLYDMNKNLMENAKSLKGKAFSNKVDKIIRPYFTDKCKDSQYFMLLSNDRRYYTVFNLCMGKYFYEDKVNDITEELSSLIRELGDVLSIDKTDDNIALEIWIRAVDEEQVYCHYLFPFDNGVIEV